MRLQPFALHRMPLLSASNVVCPPIGLASMQAWQCTQVFEGHSHYVMQVVFNPKVCAGRLCG